MSGAGIRRVSVVMTDQAISPDARGGGSALVYSHLEMLAAAGCELRLAVLVYPGDDGGFDRFTRDPEQRETWSAVRGWLTGVQKISLLAPPRESAPWRHALLAARDPSRFLFRAVESHAADAVSDFLSRGGPDLVWAEHLLPAIFCLRARPACPVVYSHHDWEWRLMRLRKAGHAPGWRHWATSILKRRVEHDVVRSADACISASAVETRQIEKAGAKVAAYFPTTYAAGTPPLFDAPWPPPLRVVHLGGMRTTASRQGLQRFLRKVWPGVEGRGPGGTELWVVGDLTGIPPELQRSLETCGARCLGFVRNLDGVLRPGDIHVIPWEFATGTRTRVPVAMCHGQVIVATAATAATLPELRDGVNARIVGDLSEMAAVIRDLAADPDQRVRLGQAARATFESEYTHSAVQSRFEKFLRSLPAREDADAIRVTA